MRRMPSGIFRPAALCHPALSSTSKMMRAMPASASRAKVSSKASKNSFDTPSEIPEGFACRRGYEARDVEPVEPVMTMRDRTLADGRPHAARNRLQANAMLVRGEDLDRLAGMVRCLFGNCIRELFLNAAASSGVADFGFFGRGFWIDQPIDFSASQPRCGAIDLRPSSPAIQSATLRLDHKPPSGGGSSRRRRNLSSRPAFRIVADAPLRRRKSPRASGPSALYGQAAVRSIARHRP